ncbi:MAG TPA: VCBS repeat-containing protein, partial [Sphingobacteriaceae bacterium]
MHSSISMGLRMMACVLGVITTSCSSPEEKSEALARKYCSSCHAFPEPALLDKGTWAREVMPQMAFRMGLNKEILWELNQNDMEEVVKIIPQRPMVSEQEWLAIKEFYEKNAPETLVIKEEKIHHNLKNFVPEEYALPSPFPSVTHIAFDSSHQAIFVATRQSMLYKLNPRFEITASASLASPASFIDRSTSPWVMAGMGIMDPNDQAKGELVTIDPLTLKFEKLIGSLKRPVHVSSADFNNDDRTDYLVSEFGNHTGRLTLFEQREKDFLPHTIHFLPGTRRTILTDFDKDGVTDILVLVTQGDEKIVVYRGHSEFNFTPETLLQFSPVYGSSYFDLVDFNNDGHPDILYTNGDNADYSQILKPYHGIRIFLNNGKGKFSESHFLAMHGASMAAARDFDQDGDLDVAAISFFPNFEKDAATGFLYFENVNGAFTPRTFD